MADNTGDNFNGDNELARLWAQHDAQAIQIQHLEAELKYARQAAVDWAHGYLELVQILGYAWEDIQSGKVTHDTVTNHLREVMNESNIAPPLSQ